MGRHVILVDDGVRAIPEIRYFRIAGILKRHGSAFRLRDIHR